MRSLLLVGTDTGVGKTTVGRGLLRLARHQGLRLVPYKPVETGCDGGEPRDAALLLAAAGIAGLAVVDVCRHAFAEPLAPSIAARLEARSIDLDDLVTHGRALRRHGDGLLVEGAGGLLTPFGPGVDAGSLAARLDADILIVAANRLGTINHTALTAAEIRRRGLRCCGFVLVDVAPTAAPDPAYNASEIAALTGLAPLGVLGHLANTADPDAIARRVAEDLDLRALFDARLVVPRMPEAR